MTHRYSIACLFIALYASVSWAQPVNLLDFGNDTPGSTSNEPAEVQVSARLTAEKLTAGEEATLKVTVTLPDGYYIYAIDSAAGFPTRIKVTDDAGLQALDEKFTPDHEPKREFEESFQAEVAKFFGTVTWQRKYRVTGTIEPGEIEIKGELTGAYCSTGQFGQCIPIRPAKLFSAVLTQTSAESATPGEVAAVDEFEFEFGDGDFAIPSEAPTEKSSDVVLTENFESSTNDYSLGAYLGLAFVGGFILNFMPCVLPVMAIKVMSFVRQAGEDRGRIFLLNVVYASGVISVFLFLAALAALPEWFGWLFSLLGLSDHGITWGGLFQSAQFNLLMACLVFAMGLSLLGVFEIPLPSFLGSAAGSAHREGLLGAFMTGIFATFLATPCTGPFMGSALAWSVKQPVQTTFLIWGMIGFGMASPYIVFGIVPGAVGLLPKPGNWMVRFKEFAGFVLMGTVIYFVSLIDRNLTIPVLVMLLGIALGFWLLGNVQASPSTSRRRIGTVTALVAGGAICWFGYSLTLRGDYELPWEEFNTARLNELREQKETVLIDFTADWCINCKTNERIALNTAKTQAFVTENNIVALEADYTDESPEIREWLEKFQAAGVPLTVIFPGSRPNEPIILDGVYSQGTLLKRLEEAVRPQAVAEVPNESR
ncbi:protein-disulfide reductase DsbD family protein [Calycomorphotria hydatis]|uniref:Thiol:disulfide interchange protein DsbD n=1 Tax=Calycomorphotria hydatis TaxID=2528027 RepID=A0A517TAF1_9PLAN|nr:thioredoxin family protein [Calycomorphotria hydatis]QDT65343.1 Thiol:disulfide interchange protein DsbD precursor [Calycomorphotria hydatis]